MSVVSSSAGPVMLAQREARRLLFIDGDPILCEFAAANLAGEGLSVETASDAEAALASLRAARPDVLMVEASLAGLDGLALLAQLRADPRLAGLPVIVVAGREDIDAVGRAYQAGADAFAVKPLNWRLLAHQVRYVHRGAQGARSLGDQLARLASAGAQFIASALGRDPSLKPAAAAFADAVDAALRPELPADAA
jgi:DNA-binding response OmpR family regulator